MTMLGLCYKGAASGEVEMMMKEMTFRAADDGLPSVMDFIEEILSSAGVGKKIIMSLCVAIEEVFVNIAHYAYGGKEGFVAVKVTLDSGVATFVVSDEGVPFNPLKKDDPDVTLGAKDRDLGGLGIFIVKKTMDKITYEHKDGKNILTMTKSLE